MNTKTYLMTAGLLAAALVTIVPSASAHNESCWVNVWPVGGNLSGCLHNAGHTTVGVANLALGTAASECTWILQNPLLGGNGACYSRSVQSPF